MKYKKYFNFSNLFDKNTIRTIIFVYIFYLYYMHISIIDDEKVLTSRISKKLKLAGYLVSEFYSYGDFMNQSGYKNPCDLYLIDISLWDGSGFDIVKFLRNKQNILTPIIIMSAFSDAQNKVFWLDIWADDYITKPIIPEELLARVRAKLRRKDHFHHSKSLLSYKNITLNLLTREIFFDKQLIELTYKEYLICELFIKNQWVIIERNKLIEYVWWTGDNMYVKDNNINVTLSKLKRKLLWNFPLQVRYNSGYILE